MLLKLIALISFLALVAHSALVKTPTLGTANMRMVLALAFITALLMVLRKEYEEIFD